MALHLTQPGQRVPVGPINVLIYGQPSSGKTSFAFTTKRPLVLDFDSGAHRSAQSPQGTTARVDSWADVEELMRADLSAYDTIVIDTVGSALDYISAYIISTNPKFGTTKGTLTMQGYGELKSIFAAWFKRLNTMGKNVVMIAHHREEKEGDATRKRPDIQGSSYGLVMKQADFVGFAFLNEAGKRVIGFAPTADYFGKDSAKLGVVTVDDFESNPTYGGDLIDTMRAAFGQAIEQGAQVAELVSVWRDTISGWSTADDFNGALADLKSLTDPSATQVRKLVADRAKAVGVKYSASNKQYEVVA